MKRTLIAILLWAMLSGCTIPWGNLPPVRYSGRVWDQARAQPAAGVRVTAMRPGTKSAFLALISDMSIGEVITDSDGRFDLSTTSGYATYLRVQSVDGRLYGGLSENLTQTDQAGLRIEIRPRILWVSSSGANLGMEGSTVISRVFTKILFAFHADQAGIACSIDEYYRRAVIDQDDYRILKSYEAFLTSADPGIVVMWGDADIVVRAFDAPLEFAVPHRVALLPGEIRQTNAQPGATDNPGDAQ